MATKEKAAWQAQKCSHTHLALAVHVSIITITNNKNDNQLWQQLCSAGRCRVSALVRGAKHL